MAFSGLSLQTYTHGGMGSCSVFLISAACPCGKPAAFAFASSPGLEVLPRWGLGENDFNFRFRKLLVWVSGWRGGGVRAEGLDSDSF